MPPTLADDRPDPGHHVVDGQWLGAMPLHEAPGNSVRALEPDPPEPVDTGDDVAPSPDTRSTSPGMVLNMHLGGSVDRIVVVGCTSRPRSRNGIGLSDPVAAAVDEAVDAVVDIIVELYAEQAGAAREAISLSVAVLSWLWSEWWPASSSRPSVTMFRGT